MTKRTIMWLRNDFRLSDNEALDYAHKNNHEILFLYIFDPSFSIGSASKWFLHHVLVAFHSSVKQKYNANLLIKIGDSKDVLSRVAKQYQIDTIIWNKRYEPKQLLLDQAIHSLEHIETKSFNSSLLFDPSEIKNLSGSYFKVFTPFWKKCLTKINDLSNPCQIPQTIHSIALNQEDQPCALDGLKLLPTNPNWAQSWGDLYKISEEDAHDLADHFMQDKVLNYKEGRDFPASNNTSLLSPYLHFGLISAKQIYFKSIFYAESEGLHHFLSEIGWREFSYHLLYHFPDLPTKNFKSQFDQFTWENNQEMLRKWQQGRTGFPLVDAGMRQLYQTGWMHNRVRMVVASFLTKNLLIDWRIGQEWFWDCLVDADLASNAASWQWVAGSGADAAPYFRIFNPITQSQKFDPKGDYIRKWLPEIAHLSDKAIHLPNEEEHYVAPMIDLKLSRQRALDIYKRISK